MTLLRSVLSSIPIYYMLLFQMPMRVVRQPEKLFRKFFWQEEADRRKLHIVRWEIICSSEDSGGLGVKGMHIMNQALLCKWQ